MEWIGEHAWLLAVAIFLARVVDVSMGVVRTIVLFRGHRWVAATLGFFEILIWVMAAGSVLRDLDRWYLAVAFAGGFALGNVVGSWLEQRMALGLELVRAISSRRDVELAGRLRDRGYSVTEIIGRGDRGDPVEVLLVVESRRRVPRLIDDILEADPEAVCTLSDVRRHAPVPPGRRGRLSGLGVSKRK